ncbi:MAG: hypothetical protein Q9187_003509 [Circinaria calcarea]
MDRRGIRLKESPSIWTVVQDMEQRCFTRNITTASRVAWAHVRPWSLVIVSTTMKVLEHATSAIITVSPASKHLATHRRTLLGVADPVIPPIRQRRQNMWAKLQRLVFATPPTFTALNRQAQSI